LVIAAADRIRSQALRDEASFGRLTSRDFFDGIERDQTTQRNFWSILTGDAFRWEENENVSHKFALHREHSAEPRV
jgi:hypothetical protein